MSSLFESPLHPVQFLPYLSENWSRSTQAHAHKPHIHGQASAIVIVQLARLSALVHSAASLSSGSGKTASGLAQKANGGYEPAP